jgi:hypothetical protein
MAADYEHMAKSMDALDRTNTILKRGHQSNR